MKPSTVEGQWHAVKKHLRQQYPELTEEDLEAIEKPEEEFIARLQHCTDKTHVEIMSSLKEAGYWSEPRIHDLTPEPV